MGCVPELRFKEFTDKWKNYKIGETLKIKHGKNQKEIECENGIYPILGTGGEIGRTNTSIHDKSSVLIGRKGTINKPVFMDTPFWTVDTLFYSQINSNFSSKFIFYIFQTINWLKYSEATGVPSLSASTIESIKNNIPSLEEQEKIANFLTKIDEKITILEDKLQLWETYKKGIMQQLFSQQLRFKDDDGNSYPVWEEKKANKCFNILGGVSFKSIDATKKGTKWLKIANVGINKINTDEISYLPESFKNNYKEYLLKKGNIILALTRPILNHKLKITIVNEFFNNSLLNQRVGKIYTKKFSDLKFIYYLLQLHENISHIENMISGSDPPNLSNKELLRMNVYIPNIKEQEKIANFLTEIDEKTQKIVNELKINKKFKKGLLQKMLC